MAFPKEERDELRRLHAAATAGEWHYDDGVTDGEGTPDAERGKAAWITAKGNVLIAEPSGCDPKEPCVPSLAEMDANGKCIVATHNAIPRLLDALDAAEAERDKALAEAAGYQKLAKACKDAEGKTVVVIIQGKSEVRVFGPNSDCEERFGEAVVRWWKLLDTVVESKAFDALKAERDALKATLAKRAESERAWCELATARGAKLAALVKASQPFANDQGCDAVHHGLADRHDQRDTCPVVARLREDLAAAKVQP